MSSRARMHATSWAAAAAGETYERGRPDYPAAAIALLAERLELGPRTRLADVAAGTGKLTRLLAGLGCRQVVAVEPMAGMRAQIARHGAAISLVAAEVEHLPLATGSLDAVTVAQAFHWFDVPRAAVELARVLGPAGRLAIVTNRPAHTTPWQADLWSTLRRYEALAPRPAATRGWRQALQDSHRFTTFERLEVPHRQRFATRGDLDARFGSISHVMLLDPGTRQHLFDDLHTIVAGQDPVVITMSTVIEVASVA